MTGFIYSKSCVLGAVVGAGLLLAIPAGAQEYVAYGAYGGPPEEVIVTAPRERFREQGSGLRSFAFPPEKVSLSQNVRYDDLDLATWDGAGELHRRVRHAARAVCGELREAYPFQSLTSAPNCYRQAVESGLVRADAAIVRAHAGSYYYGYEYGY
ncbi:MAG: UrcA family protein [Alphaproteobacteria bacterium]|nr:UrcA family protein [Alphaproteobacteria bacterium]